MAGMEYQISVFASCKDDATLRRFMDAAAHWLPRGEYMDYRAVKMREDSEERARARFATQCSEVTLALAAYPDIVDYADVQLLALEDGDGYQLARMEIHL